MIFLSVKIKTLNTIFVTYGVSKYQNPSLEYRRSFVMTCSCHNDQVPREKTLTVFRKIKRKHSNSVHKTGLL